MIKEIPISELRVGMYLAEQKNAWVPDGNRRKKGFLKSKQTIEKIRQLGVETVYIDLSKSEVSATAGASAEALATQSGFSISKSVAIEEERERAARIHGKAKDLIGNVLNEVKCGEGVDTQPIKEMADDIIDSLDRNMDALACLSQIKNKDDYLLEHSVNVGILMGVFARYKQIPEQTTKELVTGALLHDIGKIMVDDAILHKTGRLDADEWEEMKRHVTYGEQVLDQTPGLSDVSRTICMLHHERLDGSGYPRGLKGAEISLYGRMAAVVDVYDAITADRVYHDGIPPDEAVKRLLEWTGFHLDTNLVYDFIRCMSIYPVGTLVELSNGRAGVVIQTNSKTPKKPIVKVFYNTRHKHNLEPVMIDLSKDRQDIEVIHALDPKEMNIDVQSFL